MRGKSCLYGVIFIFMLVGTNSLHSQQEQVDDYDELEAFLPGDDDAKILLMIECTQCHSAAATKQRIAARSGRNLTFWTTLVRRMNTTWNGKIPDEDIDAITAYLAKYFGPSSKDNAGKSEKKPSLKQKVSKKSVKGQ